MAILANIEGPDLLIVLVIVLILFGAKRIPEMARSLGQAKREFEKGSSGQDATTPAAAPEVESKPGETPAVSKAEPDHTGEH